MAPPARQGRILVLKHGALGDFILATGPFAAIRKHHPDAHLVLLTTAPYEALARACGWFDEVWLDARPKPHHFRSLWRLRRRLNAGRLERVYDLQTSQRSSRYFYLFRRPKPEWSGIARGASHPHRNPARNRLHVVDRQREQLADAGIADVPAPDLSWLAGDLGAFAVPARYALLVPGGAPHRPAKRWPPVHYAALGRTLIAQGLGIVLIGAAADRGATEAIAAEVPAALNLCDRTGFGELASLARGAAIAVGNDTGPMHLIATVGCPAVVLFARIEPGAVGAARAGGLDHRGRGPSHALAR
jgi:ADP-heptose:LPS heptosyltransferase